MNETPEITIDDNPKKGGDFIPYLILLVLLVLLVLGSGYYFLQQPNTQALLDKAKDSLGFKIESIIPNSTENEALSTNPTDSKDEEIKRLQAALYQKEIEVQNLAQNVQGLSTSVQEIQNTATKLRYTIKPKKQIVAECYSMQIGSWEIPQSCLLAVATKVNAELENDKKVVAFEVQGVVDTNPYRGLSPELKQEGLASFRAWNAIREINAKLPNATAFEGPSLQLLDKRGYRIKAYFVD